MQITYHSHPARLFRRAVLDWKAAKTKSLGKQISAGAKLSIKTLDVAVWYWTKLLSLVIFAGIIFVAVSGVIVFAVWLNTELRKPAAPQVQGSSVTEFDGNQLKPLGTLRPIIVPAPGKTLSPAEICANKGYFRGQFEECVEELEEAIKTKGTIQL